MVEYTETETARLRALEQAIGLLWSVRVDHEDPAQERAYYILADATIAAVIVTPASNMAGLQVKAEAVAWCCASRTDFALGNSTAEQVMDSILRDLLRARSP